MISLNGFKDDIQTWATSASIPVSFVEWSELREDVLRTLEGTFTVLLDQVSIADRTATSISNPNSSLFFSEELNRESVANFPEFSVYPEPVELCIRRLRRLCHWQEQLLNGQSQYQKALETVQLVSDRDSYLSLEEAWLIEDAFSRYAGRTYSAVKETAQALKNLTGSANLKSVKQEIHNSFQQDCSLDHRTGDAGVRDALNALAFMKLVERPIGRGGSYRLTPLGEDPVRQVLLDPLYPHQSRRDREFGKNRTIHKGRLLPDSTTR